MSDGEVAFIAMIVCPLLCGVFCALDNWLFGGTVKTKDLAERTIKWWVEADLSLPTTPYTEQEFSRWIDGYHHMETAAAAFEAFMENEIDGYELAEQLELAGDTEHWQNLDAVRSIEAKHKAEIHCKREGHTWVTEIGGTRGTWCGLCGIEQPLSDTEAIMTEESESSYRSVADQVRIFKLHQKAKAATIRETEAY